MYVIPQFKTETKTAIFCFLSVSALKMFEALLKIDVDIFRTF